VACGSLARMPSVSSDRLAAADAAEPGTSELGATLRRLRRQAGLTVEQLAQEVGVSRSLISAIELGRAGPSLGTLRRTAKALGVPMAALFVEDDETHNVDSLDGRTVVRRAARKRIATRRSGIAYELLTPDVNRSVEFFWAEFEPRASAPPEADEYTAHAGEENALCLFGGVVFTVGTREFTLSEGDSISFDCSVPHRLENKSDRSATVIFAISPPSF
jgi:transcriptional regulator with XRE-family HTH domain